MGAYIGVNEIAKKISKIYVGVDNKAKKVKKGYVGVNGIARLFFKNEDFKVLGTVGSSNYSACYGQSIASTSDYFIVAGGKNNANASLQTDIAEVWDVNFIKRTIAPITSRFYHKAGSVGNHAVFIGGFATVSGWSYSSCSSIVEAYDNNLVKKTCDNLSQPSFNTPIAFNEKHLMKFGGGQYSKVDKTVDSYDIDLVKTMCTSLSTQTKLSASTRVGNYLINAGGSSSTSASGGCLSDVQAYSNDLVKTTCTGIDVAVVQATGVWVNGYAMIIGGNQNSETGTTVKNINIYDENLTKRQSINFPLAISKSKAVTIDDGEYALIGANSGTWYVYDKDLVLIKILEGTGIAGSVGNSTTAAAIKNIACMIEYDKADLLKSIVYR